MALLSIQQAHVGAQQSGADGDTGSAQGQYTGQGPGYGTGVTAALIPSSVIQTVYNCQQADQPLAVVCLDTATRTVFTAIPGDATPVLGVILRKNSDTTAVVVAYGPVTGFAGLAIGQRYFLTHDGGITAPPLSPEDAQYIHPVGFAVTDDTLFVMPQWPKLKRVMDA
jgi:hypothetical protein